MPASSAAPLVPHPPTTKPQAAANVADGCGAAADDWVPTKPFVATEDFVSPRRPASNVGSARRARPQRPVGATARAAAEHDEARLRSNIEAEESKAYNGMLLAALKAEACIDADPTLEGVETIERESITRSETHSRKTVLRLVEARLDAIARERGRLIMTLSAPVFREHERIAKDLYETQARCIALLAADFMGDDAIAAIAADEALSLIRISGDNPAQAAPEASAQAASETSPQRRSVPRRPTAQPPSTVFPGDVGGGRLRWSEEKQWMAVHQSARKGLAAIGEEESAARTDIETAATFAAMELLQHEYSLRCAAVRAEEERVARADVATWGVDFTPDDDDESLERDPRSNAVLPEAIRQRRALLRIQRVFRSVFVRNGEVEELRVAAAEEEKKRAIRMAAIARIQRHVRGFLGRCKRRTAAYNTSARTDMRIFEENRMMNAGVIQAFARAHVSTLEAEFHRVRPEASQLHQLQAWLTRSREEYIDDETSGDYFLLPPFVKTGGPQPDPTVPTRTDLAACFRVRQVLVCSDADLDSKAFTDEWADFVAALNSSPVAAVGLDAEWVGPRLPSLLQIADHTRCFLFRLHLMSPDRCHALLNPLFSSPRVFKCGVGIRHDRKKLHDAGYAKIEHLLDLVTAVAEVDLLPESGRGLEAVCLAATGLRMGKQKGTTMSDWEAETLSVEQRSYATDDAVAGLAILAAALEKARRLRFLPPHRHGPWALRDDEAAYKWLARVAASKPPPPAPKRLDEFSSPTRPPKEFGAAAATANGGHPDVMSADEQREKEMAIRLAKLPRPEDITVTEAKPLYDNIRVISIEGKHIFTCDTKKANWYVKKKKLATVTQFAADGKMSEIRLNFEPAAKTKLCMNWQLGSCSFGNDCMFAHGVEELIPAKNMPLDPEGNPAANGPATTNTATAEEVEVPDNYIAAVLPEVDQPHELGGVAEDKAAAIDHLRSIGRVNACTICFVTGAVYTKFPVIPSHFRRHLAADLRRARTFDYVPICSMCLPRVQATFNSERRHLWECALRAMPADQRSTRLSYSAATRLYRYAEMIAMPERMQDIPARRKWEIQGVVLEAFPRSLLPAVTSKAPAGEENGAELTPDEIEAAVAAHAEMPAFLAAAGPAMVPEDLSDTERTYLQEREAVVAKVVRYVTSYDLQDWTHSTEAMDVVWHQRELARQEAEREKAAEDPISPARHRATEAGEASADDDALLEMKWGVQFVRHWRRVFETQLRPLLVPWAQLAPPPPPSYAEAVARAH